MKPRILVLTKLFWPEGGGAELATYLIVKDILSKHFDVTIVSGTRSPEPDILKHARYIHWSALEARYKPIEWIKTFMGIGWVRNLVEGGRHCLHTFAHPHTPNNSCENH